MTNRHSRRHAAKRGQPPGTPIYTGERLVENAVITYLAYGPSDCAEGTCADAKSARALTGARPVTWINITGLHDTELLTQFGEVFGIHPLVVEDIANTSQRPKMEDHGHYLFIVARMNYLREGTTEIVTEQLSLILGEGFVLSFQELPGDVFGIIRDRIRTDRGRIRKLLADYLAYSLLDALVDNYFLVVDELGDQIEALQARVVGADGSKMLSEIQSLKTLMIMMRRHVWPLREMVGALSKQDSSLIREDTAPYLHDVYEHAVHVMDTVDSLREMLSAALEVHMNMMSNRINDVMRLLTVISTIFIPLTFVVGVYGMNFQFMPELHWRYSYAAVWVVMAVIAGSMVAFFRRRKWL